MKRSTFTTFLAFALFISIACPVKACCCFPYIPWLDPFAWLGLYGCGGCGYGYGGCGGYGYGGGFAPQAYNYAPVAPIAPMMNYPVAPQPGCGCTGAVQPQAQMTAVQVPVTTYRAVTQYVPQTTYQTQYRYQQATAFQPQVAYNTGIVPAQTAYANPGYPVSGYPATAYAPGSFTPVQNYATAGAPVYDNGYFPAPTYSSPTMQPSMNIASPIQGDVYGDHETPSQNAARPPVMLNSFQGSNIPVKSISYGVTPRPARSYSSIVR